MNATLYRFPQFTVTSTACADGVTKWVGRFGQSMDMSEGYAFLCTDSLVFIEGKFEIDTAAKEAVFRLSDSTQAEYLKIGSSYTYLDGYWGERAALVFDESRRWKRTKFEPKNSVRVFLDGKQETQVDGWDHEHCAICWEKIAHFGDYARFGYQDQDNHWVCERCYEDYIVHKSLDFIVE